MLPSDTSGLLRPSIVTLCSDPNPSVKLRNLLLSKNRLSANYGAFIAKAQKHSSGGLGCRPGSGQPGQPSELSSTFRVHLMVR